MGVPFTVQIFPGYYLPVQIPMERYARGERHVMHLKQIVGQVMGLKEDSLHIFGIYTGRLGEPMELCADTYPLLANVELSFQRLACSKEEELEVIADDERALQLVFWELKYRCEHAIKFPRPQKDMEKCMDYQRRFASACLSSNTIMTQMCHDYAQSTGYPARLSRQLLLAQVARTIPQYYTVYTNIIENCILRYTLATHPPVRHGTQINVVMDSSHLVVLDLSGKELIAWTWDALCIECPGVSPWPVWHPLSKKTATALPSPPPSRTGDMDEPHVGEGDMDEPRDGISFITEKCMYIYSVSLYFQREYYDRGEID